MFTSIRSIYGALGVMLFLIAMYLVLDHSQGTTKIITSVASGAERVFTVLQGRTP